MMYRTVAVVLALTGAALVPCRVATSTAAGLQPGVAPVTITAHDYGFAGPDRIPAGMTTVEVINEGHDLHHAQLVRLAQGKTAADFAAAMKASPNRLPSWISFVGGPNAVLPGDRSSATMQLNAGQYLILCLIPDNAGVPHVALGMERPLTVTAAVAASSIEPTPDITITANDFYFDLSKPITAGPHTIQVTNGGSQAHEVVLVKLASGATVKEFLAAVEPGAAGPPPGRPLGGIVGLDREGRGYFTSTFEPGRYALICFFPDVKTGTPHFSHGMTREFTVD
jgi:uncharacterized cupredoxin-like copper-binding protein